MVNFESTFDHSRPRLVLIDFLRDLIPFFNPTRQ